MPAFTCPTLDKIEDTKGWADPTWDRNVQQSLERMLGVRLKASFAAYIGHRGDSEEMRLLRFLALKSDVIAALAPTCLSAEQLGRLFDCVRLSNCHSVYENIETFRSRAELFQSVLKEV